MKKTTVAIIILLSAVMVYVTINGTSNAFRLDTGRLTPKQR